MNHRPTRGIAVAAVLMILFGLAEVATSFTHKFFGIATTAASPGTYIAATIGVLYTLSGLLVLTMKKWAAALAIVFLLTDIAGRAALVGASFYPTNSFRQIFAIITGTVVVALFAIYIGSNWKSFN
ncbi:MAG: hypothetical protein WBF06_07875 [Candidatus Acidiferrales bacterium]